MNKEIKCSNCVKFKTQYCPCTIDCMATDDYPFYQDRRMMLEENTNLKQALIDIKKYCEANIYDISEHDEEYQGYDCCVDGFEILKIVEKVLGDENKI